MTKEEKKEYQRKWRLGHLEYMVKANGRWAKANPKAVAVFRQRYIAKKGFIYRNGYKYIYHPEHLFSDGTGCVPEHHLIMESHLGALICPALNIVHHINGIRDDNRIENLKILSRAEHMKLHRPEKIRWKSLIKTKEI